MAICESYPYRGRHGVRLANDLIEVIVLPGGGHVARISFLGLDLNPLWEPPWQTLEPQNFDPRKHPEFLPGEGKLLASIAGHNLCLDHFGELSPAEVQAGGYFHGEAPNLPWKVIDQEFQSSSATLKYGLQLPEAGIQFTRRLTLQTGSAIVSFEEEIVNLRARDIPLEYQQHVTVGPPFLQGGVTRVGIPGTKGRTFLRGLGPVDRLKPDQDFVWPNAPGVDSEISVDVFPQAKSSYSVCGVLLNPKDGHPFITVWNAKLGLLLGYVFPLDLFNWTALWEENNGVLDSPWNGRTRAWGIEFGTTPTPATRMENLTLGNLFGKPRFRVLPARGSLSAKYRSFLLKIPGDWRGVDKVVEDGAGLTICESGNSRRLTV